MKKLFLFPLVIVFGLFSCNSEDYRIETINKAEAYFYTYKKQYDSFNEIQKYCVVSSFLDFPEHAKNGPLFFCINFYDIKDSEDNYDYLYESVRENNTHIIFYNFTNLTFLKNTKFDYHPKGDDYSIAENHFIALSNKNRDEGFYISSLFYGGSSGKLSFEDTSLNYAYTRITEL